MQPQQSGPADRRISSLRYRWRASGVAAVLVLALSGCGMDVQFQAGGDEAASTATSAASTPTPSPTATPAATATPTPAPTATPNATATAEADVTQHWSQAVKQVGDINSALADLGTKFNNGSISMQQGAGQLQSLDQQAATINHTVQSLPPPPGLNDATLSHYRQSVNNWSGAIRDLDNAVGQNDIFGAPRLANKLEGIAADLDQQGTNLHLPPSA